MSDELLNNLEIGEIQNLPEQTRYSEPSTIDVDGDTPATQNVVVYSFFLTSQSENPEPDASRQLDDQNLKFYPYFEVSLERQADTQTWDVDNLFTQKLICSDFVLASVTNQDPDGQRPLDKQEIKFYSTFDIEADNPPWCYAEMTLKDSYKVSASNDPYEYEQKTFIDDWYIARGPDDPDIQFAIVQIRTSFSVSDGDGGDKPIEPDPDQGETDNLEYLTEYIRIIPTFKVNDTAKVLEKCNITSWLENTGDVYVSLKENLKMSFYQSNEELNPNALDTTVACKSFFKIHTKELANLLEYVRISDYYYTKGGSSDEATITYVVNEGNETTRYEHWPFESYAAFKGMYLGCCADGVYVLSGDNDDGEPIEAMINFGKQSFGSANYKRVPYVYASLAGDGDVYLQVSYNEDEQYMYPARKVDEYNATARFDLGRGIKANYLTFELYNENGSKFDLRNLWIYLTELSRRI